MGQTRSLRIPIFNDEFKFTCNFFYICIPINFFFYCLILFISKIEENLLLYMNQNHYYEQGNSKTEGCAYNFPPTKWMLLSLSLHQTNCSVLIFGMFNTLFTNFKSTWEKKYKAWSHSSTWCFCILRKMQFSLRTKSFSFFSFCKTNNDIRYRSVSHLFQVFMVITRIICDLQL